MQLTTPLWLRLTVLILAGEAVFLLPFVVQRIFRPTFLETFGISNTELGLCFSVYGLVAMLAYLLGGPIADRFLPNRMMAVGLCTTALGGVYPATYPPIGGLYVLYGYWGVTSILLFWAGLIKTTRLWGESSSQVRAFSWLDGGRGLVAALIATLGVQLLGQGFAGEGSDLSVVEKQQAFRYVWYVFSLIVGLVGLLTWLGLRTPEEEGVLGRRLDWPDIKLLLKRHDIYLISLVILAGYSGYKVSDIFSLYANEVLLYDEVSAAGICTLLLYCRPIIGVSLGLVADRRRPSSLLLLLFILMGAASLLLAVGIGSIPLLALVSILLTAMAVFGLRCVYYGLLAEMQMPIRLTGTAVGIVPVIGYSPDVFMGPIVGLLIDGWPGEQGYQLVFALLVVFSIIGCAATWWLRPFR